MSTISCFLSSAIVFDISTSNFGTVNFISNLCGTSVQARCFRPVWEESSDRGSEKFLVPCEKWERLSRYIMMPSRQGQPVQAVLCALRLHSSQRQGAALLPAQARALWTLPRITRLQDFHHWCSQFYCRSRRQVHPRHAKQS